MDALLTSRSPPIASEDDLSDFDATEVGEDEEIGERLHIRSEDRAIDVMHDSSDTDLDSPIEEIAAHIKLYSFSGVSFRSGKVGKSQSDYAVLNRKSAPCD
jgi:U3 small nucleolar RNA-associated protein 14